MDEKSKLKRNFMMYTNLFYSFFAISEGDTNLALPYVNDIYNRKSKIIYLNEFVFEKNKKDKFISFDDTVNRDIVKKYSNTIHLFNNII